MRGWLWGSEAFSAHQRFLFTLIWAINGMPGPWHCKEGGPFFIFSNTQLSISVVVISQHPSEAEEHLETNSSISRPLGSPVRWVRQDSLSSLFSSSIQLESPGTSLETVMACVIVRQPVGADTSGSRPPSEFSEWTPRAERKVFGQEPNRYTKTASLYPSVIEEFCFFCCRLNFLFKLTALYLKNKVKVFVFI